MGMLTQYGGNRYNGGYGDVLEIDSNLFLAVYYISDADETPWIEGRLFSFNVS
jgi:hypothetical protein